MDMSNFASNTIKSVLSTAGMLGGSSGKTMSQYKAYLKNMSVDRLCKIASNKNIPTTTKRDGKTKKVKKDTIIKKLLEDRMSKKRK